MLSTWQCVLIKFLCEFICFNNVILFCPLICVYKIGEEAFGNCRLSFSWFGQYNVILQVAKVAFIITSVIKYESVHLQSPNFITLILHKYMHCHMINNLKCLSIKIYTKCCNLLLS